MTINEAKKILESHFLGYIADRGFLYNDRFYFNLVSEMTGKIPLIGGVPFVDQKTEKVGIMNPANVDESFDLRRFNIACSKPIRFTR